MTDVTRGKIICRAVRIFVRNFGFICHPKTFDMEPEPAPMESGGERPQQQAPPARRSSQSARAEARRRRRSSAAGDRRGRRSTFTSTTEDTPLNRELKLLAWAVTPTILAHPLNFVQVLMQIGYEPQPPRVAENLMGNPVVTLASINDFFSHIREHDGVNGLYRGLGPSVAHAVATFYLARGCQKVADLFWRDVLLLRPTRPRPIRFSYPARTDRMESFAEGMLREEPGPSSSSSSSGPDSFADFFLENAKELAIVSVVVTLTWPLHVIALRTMAQFVGGERIYNGIASSTMEIYSTEGIPGFFGGVLPGWLNAVVVTTLTNAFMYLSTATSLKDYTGQLGKAIAHSFIAKLCYPIRLVSRLAAISGARLAAARPPFIPKYPNSYQLYQHIIRNEQETRGYFLFHRRVSAKAAAEYVTPEDIPSETVSPTKNPANNFFFPFKLGW